MISNRLLFRGSIGRTRLAGARPVLCYCEEKRSFLLTVLSIKWHEFA